MKRLLVVLLLAAPSLWAQQRFVAAPYFSFTSIDSMIVTSGSDTVKGAAASVEASMASIDTAQLINSPLFPRGTAVVAILDSITVLMSEDATATDTLATLQYGYYTNLPYAIGDVYGNAVKAPSFSTIYSIAVMDTGDVQDSVKVIFYDGEPLVQLDNAAYAATDADIAKIIAVVTMGTSEDVGTGKIIYTPSTWLPLHMEPENQVWIQLVAWGAADHKSMRPIRVLLIGE